VFSFCLFILFLFDEVTKMCLNCYFVKIYLAEICTVMSTVGAPSGLSLAA